MIPKPRKKKKQRIRMGGITNSSGFFLYFAYARNLLAVDYLYIKENIHRRTKQELLKQYLYENIHPLVLEIYIYYAIVNLHLQNEIELHVTFKNETI